MPELHSRPKLKLRGHVEQATSASTPREKHSPMSMIPRLTTLLLISVLLPLAASACGASGSKKNPARTSTTGTATTTTTAAIAGVKQPRSSTHKKSTVPKKTKTISTTPAKTTTSTTPAKTKTTSTTPAKTKTTSTTPDTQTVPALPSPVVSGSAAGMHATLHGENHAPTVKQPWYYSVLATDASGHPLAGTVDTEFVFGGQIVGRETPPTHPLTDGRLNDNVTFPAQSVGVSLTFQVVVHTTLGSVTLDWPVKVQK
jgi:hypothetical protein